MVVYVYVYLLDPIGRDSEGWGHHGTCPLAPMVRACVGVTRGGTQEVAKEDTGEVWLLTIVNPQGDRGQGWQVVVDGRTLSWNPIRSGP